MPSIKYYNQTAPFWDFVASLEQTGAQHPFFNRGNGEGSSTEQQQQPNWAEAWGPWHGRPMPHHPHPRGPPPHHGRGGRHGHGHHPPPPPGEEPPHHGEHPPPPPPPPPEFDPEDSPDTLMGDNEKTAEGARDLVSGDEGATSGPEGRHRRRGFGGPHRGRGRRGSPHGHGPEHHGPGPHRGGRHHRGGGGPPFPFGAPWGMGRWADFLTGNITGENDNTNNNATARETDDFKPEADVFDTESSYVVHLSLAGAKKEDIGVSWDAEKSELSVAGVIHRPGDEDFLKTLALDERRVGVFERKVRLGSRANPAQVDADSITAKLTDGVLVVEVPKLDKDYVEIRKVDIE